MFTKESIKYPEIREVDDREYCEKIVAQSIEKVEAAGIEIGNGRTARILVSELDNRICMKAVGEKTISSNDVAKEMMFLDRLSAKGRRVPKPVCAVTTNKKDYLFQEHVPGGLSIENILKDKTGEILKRIPKDFDFKNFFEELRREVEMMHNDRIYHRDLHAGNIMIHEDGRPMIVDFGDATEQFLSSEDPYKYVNGRGKEVHYPDTDEQLVAMIYKKFGQYLADRGWFNK